MTASLRGELNKSTQGGQSAFNTAFLNAAPTVHTLVKAAEANQSELGAAKYCPRDAIRKTAPG